MHTLIIVLGPTGVGKSQMGIKLAQHYHTDILSADSRQIYKELTVGTAVPSPEDLQLVPHYFIQTKSIHDYYNVSNYETEVLKLLDELFLDKKQVILVGGSMLYLDTVCNGIDDIPTVDPNIRKNVIHWYEENGMDSLRQRLKEIDPDYYNTVDLNNHKRMLHAVEIYEMTGLPFTSFRKNLRKERPFKMIKIGINQDRNVLYDRINQRVIKMMDEGLLNEARSVYPYKELNSLNTVGYKELFGYFDGDCSLEEAVDLIQRNTRKYARKQLTWFRRDPLIHWFEPDQFEEVVNFIDLQLTKNLSNQNG
jgi:tRNA dimethylallyltransferase